MLANCKPVQAAAVMVTLLIYEAVQWAKASCLNWNERSSLWQGQLQIWPG